MEAKTILIVDDSADNRAVYSLFLEHFGYTVLQAGDGWEGVCRARESHPDAILMDVSMPGLNGLDATRMLKSAPDTAGIPVIVVTAHTDPETKQRAHATGCDAFLRKPVAPSQLAREVERFLDPAAEQESGTP